jgi:hypothetical protein
MTHPHPTSAPVNIFLSYTRKKDQFLSVSSFRERLEVEVEMRSPGSRVFQDKQHLLEGFHFPEVIFAELMRADVLLALVSPAWLRSEWCRREFSVFTADAADSTRLHRILPVLWVDTPEMNSNSSDIVARTLANINYADWRELRYESWENPMNQRQVGKLAEAAIALLSSAPLATVRQTTEKTLQHGARTDRLSASKEAILLALNASVDGLAEDDLVQSSNVSQTRASAYLRELQAEGYLRMRYTVRPRANEWVLCPLGKVYLVRHNLLV